jgi:chromosome segregation protein
MVYLEQLDDSVQKSQHRKDEVSEVRRGRGDSLQRTKDKISVLKENINEKYSLFLPKLQARMEKERSLTIETDEGLSELLIESEDDRSLVLPFYLKNEHLENSELLTEWREDFQRYTIQLQNISEVNFLAISEHLEVKIQLDSLVDQRSDLEDSAQQIRDVIEELNALCTERFLNAVDAVNEQFKVIYPRLVGGGYSKIQLLDREQPLTSGVAIYAQPPGKKLEKLSLLSGGERAMVAISLLFSLFKVKPSPICLMDEVDAPLDEGNGGRFNAMLKEMSTAAQFIVITHNKKTMEAVDVLYGVSMPSPGISQLVSVRLD